MGRYDGFKDDDGRYQWRAIRRHLRSRYHVAVMRLDNRWQDARARLAGACNADLWTGEPPGGYAGGYSHWRCGKRRGHLTNPEWVDAWGGNDHRFNNYIWSGRPEERSEYAPLPIRNEDNTGWFDTRTVIPFRKLAEGRRAVPTRRRSRLQAKWQEDYMAEVRRKPRKIPNPYKETTDG